MDCTENDSEDSILSPRGIPVYITESCDVHSVEIPQECKEAYQIQTIVNMSALPRPKKCQRPSWFEPYHRRLNNIRPVRHTIHRNNKQAVCNILPVVSVSNLRSLMPKISNFKDDMLEREIGLALLSEVWEQKNKKKHQFEIQKLLQMEGLKYISTPRPKKRGGGAAIVANLSLFSLDKLDIFNPHNLEVVWRLFHQLSLYQQPCRV